MSATQRVQQWATFARTWHVFDCTWQNPFESAQLLRKYLLGLHKPIYHPMNESGDHVVAINTKEIALPGEEWRKRVYFHHTGYPGGASWTLAWELHEKDPTMIVKKAVYTAMRGNLQRRHTMQRLHLFKDGNIPKDILENISNQIPSPRKVPERLDKMDPETVRTFPKIMDWPNSYILK
ncbi:large ribosomal subunit protein uL13m [Phlebotomus argentipes]|uniref:large ribosomal subunit protein uL13m n=1 Tax=Phlebotomus argentipes TaxID=94469 RepID=UPI002892D3A2|nr:large ribosomal subunit protein uL13m [Phlebotomus argentipes]